MDQEQIIDQMSQELLEQYEEWERQSFEGKEELKERFKKVLERGHVEVFKALSENVFKAALELVKEP